MTFGRFTKLLATAVVAMGFVTAAAQAATVTFMLVPDDPAPGQFSLYADVSVGDNGGLAFFGVDLVGVDDASIQNLAPMADVSLVDFKPKGFTVARSGTAGNPPTNPVTGGQDVLEPLAIIYGVGQAAGSIPGAPLGGTVIQENFGAPILLATGNITGQLGFGPNVAANVFIADGVNQATEAAVLTTIVPEPASFALLAIGTLLTLRRRTA